jgi:hypothetical protein
MDPDRSQIPTEAEATRHLVQEYTMFFSIYKQHTRLAEGVPSESVRESILVFLLVTAVSA